MSTASKKLFGFLDTYLNISEVPDWPTAFNGLQVEGPDQIKRMLVAVDASQASIEAAVAGGFDLLLVHHGLFWSGVPTVTGRNYQRLHPLLTNRVGVYSAHIPLDVHPEVGNNAVLAGMLDLKDQRPFGAYETIKIGVQGATELTLSELNSIVERELNCRSQVLATGSPMAGRVAVVTGAGGSFIEEAHRVGVDTLVTGEANHHSYPDAEEWGINVILAGHYATETVGVKALAAEIAERFAISWEFFDHPTGL